MKNKTKNPNNHFLANPLQTQHKPGFNWIPESQLACLHGDFYGVQFSSRLLGRLHIFQREEVIWLCWDSIGTIDPRGPGSAAEEGNKAASVFWE